MKSVPVTTETKSYQVFIEAGLRLKVGQFIERQLSEPVSSIFIITDRTVARHYLGEVKKSLASYPLFESVIAVGEASKSFRVYEQLLTEALSHGLDRQSMIIALGGGVVGDVAGFVAATYMRGIRYVQVPTTLLAHDSSVGGKVAINHPLGKNMIGAFHQPEMVLYDPETFETLPLREWRSGFAEVMKHGLIQAPSFYDWLREQVQSFEGLTTEDLNEMLARSIAVKAAIVSKDEQEMDIRAYLNFGHTLGHAIETELGYGRISHGEAVVIGMVFALRLSERVFQCQLPCKLLSSWLAQLGYETAIPNDLLAKDLVETMKKG